jgi:L,D-peptidoglycan transpeptidase YkuD (ErfK/YbiS/YcfS/YnhG family)
VRWGVLAAVSALALTVVQPQPTQAGDRAALGHTRRAATTTSREYTPPTFARRVPQDTTQVVRTVSSRFWCTRVYCTVTQAWRKQHGQWQLVRHFRSSIGPNGWNKQREGDNRSPNGIFRIKTTFSTGRHAPGPMRWKRRLPTSTVTNYPGRLYNTWIEERGRSDGDRPSMRYGFIVNYNHVRLRPSVGPKPIQGKGSGIFYHTSKPGHRWDATRGCTQIGKPDNMRWLVRWLRPAAHPRVVQNR